ncbi:MAG: hypothetical protein DWQ02_09400 [Bacteroidetes bacterium]|nr:MAG: hypothetical protein DWQ02_09400 [Bacteroidota bacterium]
MAVLDVYFKVTENGNSKPEKPEFTPNFGFNQDLGFFVTLFLSNRIDLEMNLKQARSSLLLLNDPGMIFLPDRDR